MTSSPPEQRHCYAFIHLPGETTPVVCGRVEQRESGRSMVGGFAYGRSYLRRPSAVPIDPITLPLQRGDFPDTTQHRGLYGALRDASPDAWGRRVIEYALGVNEELSEMAYLLAAGNDRPGALAFGPTSLAPSAETEVHDAIALPALINAAEVLEDGGPATAATRRAALLLLHGVSMGGARPKALVKDDDRMWLAKFPGKKDRYNMAAVEAGLLSLAAECGIDAPAHRVLSIGGRPVLLVERFDRQGPVSSPRRARYLSGLTLLDADEVADGRWSYLGLAEEIRRRSCQPDADRRQLFRRAVFNALVSNGDDHPRNHAVIAWGQDDWRLSPVFDVVPTEPQSSREHKLALFVGRDGRLARRANLLSETQVFGLARDEASAIIDEQVRTLSARWEAVMKHHGASVADLGTVRGAIVPAGFED
ncbi:MAG: type II toxin-antitoxin system HipA family toxin [Gemmatimonadales bacterium]|nr:type II toxin-antitoxin system HipA family toxin [Gemmatimonadales bacterium]